MAQWLSFGSTFCGRWFDLQWGRSWYILLIRPNSVETVVQCFHMSHESVRWIFLVMVIQFTMKKLQNRKVTVMPVVVGALGTVPKWLAKETGRNRDKMKNRDHQDYSTLKISQFLKESSRTEETLCHSYFRERRVKTGTKNQERV